MKTILLIDDDENDRELFKKALQTFQSPYQFFEATDGHEALSLIYNRKFEVPDIIFLDLKMPKVNGLEFLTSIKMVESYQKVPVIIYSTTMNEKERQLCLSFEASFMVKPSYFKDLCAELKQLLTT